LAASFGGDRLVKSEEPVGRSHGRMIIKKMSDLFESANLSKNDIAGLVVGVGPGSFTGLRIGLAAAKGMALALDIPIIAVSLFEVAEHKLSHDDEPVRLLLPFKSDALFSCKRQAGRFNPETVEVISRESLIGPANGQKIVAIGFDAGSPMEQALNTVGVELVAYDASDLMAIGRIKAERGEFADRDSLEPMYLQKSQAEIILEKRQKGTPS
jgi:tRNA threonylcarbamoyladenosine biosynthesis protein TsaB